MRHLDLFSGIGGFALAAQWVWGPEHEIVSFCEIDPFCRKVLKKHWPNVPIIEDIREVSVEIITSNSAQSGCEARETDPMGNQESPAELFTSYRSQQHGIDLLTGGFPCQPFSCAGKRKGKEDNRFLWPEMLRVIAEVRPRFILAENVPGIIRMELDNCLSALEAEGYTTGTLVIPACAVNAPHRRDRVWIVGYSKEWEDNGRERGIVDEAQGCGGSGYAPPDSCREDVPNSTNNGCNRNDSPRDDEGQFSKDSEQPGGGRSSRVAGCGSTIPDPFSLISGRYGSRWSSGVGWWEREPAEVVYDARGGRGEEIGVPEFEPQLGRVANGIPNRVDRLRALGNAIVPQVAAEIMQAIKQSKETP